MTKIFTYIFDKWWKPILFFAIAFGLVVISKIIENNALIYVSYLLLLLGMLGLLISAIYQFVRKRWFKAIATLFCFIGSMGFFVVYLMLTVLFGMFDGDQWADNLTIPENIELHIPKGDGWETRPDSTLILDKSKIDFELYNSFQPGLYEYDLCIGNIESGTVYLKAFEITQECPLSTDRLPKRSSIKVENRTDGLMIFGTKDNFTIYEGDWGKPYAARFEVWFRPDNNGPERKLLEKNYKIEGWMR